jgi:hypothetical protein
MYHCIICDHWWRRELSRFLFSEYNSVKFVKNIILCRRTKKMFVCFMVVKQPTLSQCVKASGMTSTWRGTARLDYRSPHSKFYVRPFWLVSCIEFLFCRQKWNTCMFQNTPFMEHAVSLSRAQNSATNVYS